MSYDAQPMTTAKIMVEVAVTCLMCLSTNASQTRVLGRWWCHKRQPKAFHHCYITPTWT